MRLKTLITVGLALASAAIPAAADTLSVRTSGDPATLDPARCTELVCWNILRNVYESLTRTSRSGAIEPSLAVRWELHADQLGWTFHLRPGVRFHSGRILTAADVKTTFERTPSSDLKHVVGATEMRAGKATGLAGVRVIDDLTLEVRLTKPDALFPHYEIWIFDSAAASKEGTPGPERISAGTGPFAVARSRRGFEVALTAHEHYWAGRPSIDGVRYAVVPRDETALNQYEAGELDVVELAQTSAARVRRDQKLASELHLAPSARIRFIALSASAYPPFADRRVRQAVCTAIDRQALVKGFSRDLSQPLYGTWPPSVRGGNPNITKPPYDPVQARRLLAEAGYPDGKGLPLLEITAPESTRDEATYFADHLNRVLGIETKAVVLEFGTFLKAMSGDRVAFRHGSWGPSYVDPHHHLSTLWRTGSPFNRARYSNAAFDRLIEQSEATFNDTDRYKLYHEAERVLLDDWAFCGTYARTMAALVKRKVKGVEFAPNGLLPFANVTIE